MIQTRLLRGTDTQLNNDVIKSIYIKTVKTFKNHIKIWTYKNRTVLFEILLEVFAYFFIKAVLLCRTVSRNIIKIKTVSQKFENSTPGKIKPA